MEINVESKITVKVGDVVLNLNRESATQLYNALKSELGIIDHNWIYPSYPSWPSNPTWTCETTDPIGPYTVVYDATKLNGSGVPNVET